MIFGWIFQTCLAHMGGAVPAFKDRKFQLMLHTMTTTSQDLAGHDILENCGVVRGIVVRSRSIVGNFLGGIQSLFGGNITIYTSLCERARSDAFDSMCQHAEQLGGNAIIGVRYESNEVMAGITEVLCYGTSVRVQLRR
jgi:uncharacterized protein YbjQ (UPF0145 family)